MFVRLIPLLWIVVLLSVGCRAERNLIEAPLKVAFIADQGFGANADAVLNLIATEGADLVIHSGDFDYLDDPDAWDNNITALLGANYPYFASVGNHDLIAWESYQQKLQARLDRIPEASCEGELGVNSICTYRGLIFMLSGIGTLGSDHLAFIQSGMQSQVGYWKICSWHKNRRLMQIGLHGDEVPWEAYDLCRQLGALVVTGHDHHYARTFLMSSFEDQTVASPLNTMVIKPGQSIAIVSGLAGRSLRAQVAELVANPWWASTLSIEQSVTYGALFCTFADNGEPDRASCYFKQIDNRVRDWFEMTSEL